MRGFESEEVARATSRVPELRCSQVRDVDDDMADPVELQEILLKPSTPLSRKGFFWSSSTATVMLCAGRSDVSKQQLKNQG